MRVVQLWDNIQWWETFKTKFDEARATWFSFVGVSALSRSWLETCRSPFQPESFCDSVYKMQYKELSLSGEVECFSLLL